MNIPLYQVDAFATEVFSGNPAAVCPLEGWLEDPLLQAIAAENNLSETAFFVPNGDGFDLRWFTPLTEVPLCGHATLASAYVLFTRLGWPGRTIRFQTRRSGQLVVTEEGGLLDMDFPARPPEPGPAPAGLLEALGASPSLVLRSQEQLCVVLEDELSVRELRPDVTALGRVPCRGVMVTARGQDCDFVSRYFAPRMGVPEDPVTGSAHCVLVPYWAGVLSKPELHARQVSKRGGELFCRLRGDRVSLAGRAALYLEGTISI